MNEQPGNNLYEKPHATVSITTPSLEQELARCRKYATPDTTPETLTVSYSQDYYTKGQEALTKALPTIEHAIEVLTNYQKMWGFEMPQDIEIRLTRVGTGGSYTRVSETQGLVVVKTDKEGQFSRENPGATPIHEITHLCIQHLVNQYNIDFERKERIVKNIDGLLFPDVFPQYAKVIPADKRPEYLELLKSLPELIKSEYEGRAELFRDPEKLLMQSILEYYPFLSEKEMEEFMIRVSRITAPGKIQRIKEILALFKEPHTGLSRTDKAKKEFRALGVNETRYPRAELLEGNILYIDIPSWGKDLVELPERVQDIMATPAEGYILDLRKNPGGSTTQSQVFETYFLGKGFTKFGTYYKKNKQGDLEIKDEGVDSLNETPISKPVIILTSDKTCSSAERTVAVLRTLPNVTVIGSETSGGMARPKAIEFDYEGYSYEMRIPTSRTILNGEKYPVEVTKIKPDFYRDPNDPEIVNFAAEIIRRDTETL